ncbi:MAG: DinB family protein [Sphingobacteriales bacterium]|nr:DinB family protein [Sphingobacteriales bacterium]
MADTLNIDEIVQRLNEANTAFIGYCASLTYEIFFCQPVDKWSPAQQTKHLIAATNTARLAYSLPKFIVRWYAGKPNRASRTFDELVAKYKLKLEQGGRASGRFVPKPVPASYGKEKLIEEFSNAMKKFGLAVKKNWKDSQLDQYIAPHPLLGKITLRELCYFTIYHTWHHLENIRALTKINPPGL